MKLRKVVGAFLLIALLMCGYALADNTLETYNALGIGAMPCQGTAKVIVFRVIFAEDGKQSDGNVIEWTNTYIGDVREAERLFFDPTLKNVVDSPKTYSHDYDSLRSFYYRSSYGKLDYSRTPQ